jgi:YgiT-type zinc finger domain-containing protein
MAHRCPNCSARKQMMRFEGETFPMEHAGLTTMVEGLSGWRCSACGEVEFDANSARRCAAVGDELVLGNRAPCFGPTQSDDVFGSLKVSGRPKTLEEMDAGVLAEARRRYRRD